jgi:hypothetical protein
MVCRAFLLAFRILGKIILSNGDTEWLKDGTPHCNVRRDFVDTDLGVRRVKDVVEVEPESVVEDTPCSMSY